MLWRVIKCIVLGICLAGSIILSGAMLVTFVVLYKTGLIGEYIMALYAMIASFVTMFILLISYIVSCKRLQRKFKLRGLIKELAENLHGVEVMHECYVGQPEQQQEPLQTRVEKMSDYISNLKGDLPDEEEDDT